jgi:hypothetical protein
VSETGKKNSEHEHMNWRKKKLDRREKGKRGEKTPSSPRKSFEANRLPLLLVNINMIMNDSYY